MFNKIKFYVSTFYKFRNLNIGMPLKLLEVFVKDVDDLHEDFLQYENEYWDWETERDSLLELPKGSKVLVLLFIDDRKHVFTIIRKYSEGNRKNYAGKRGELFRMDFIKKWDYDVY